RCYYVPAFSGTPRITVPASVKRPTPLKRVLAYLRSVQRPLPVAVLIMASFVAGFISSNFGLVQRISGVGKRISGQTECLAEMHEGICLGASRFESAPHEELILAKLPPPPPASRVSISSDFTPYLEQAVGWANIPPATI